MCSSGIGVLDPSVSGAPPNLVCVCVGDGVQLGGPFRTPPQVGTLCDDERCEKSLAAAMPINMLMATANPKYAQEPERAGFLAGVAAT